MPGGLVGDVPQGGACRGECYLEVRCRAVVVIGEPGDID